MGDGSIDEQYPEHAKLRLISDESQVIGEFLDWLPSQDIHLGKFGVGAEQSPHRLYPVHIRIADLLAIFFDIDPEKIEAEKRAMLGMLAPRS